MVGVAIGIGTIEVEITGMEEVTKVIAIGAQDDIEVLQEPDHHRDTGGMSAGVEVVVLLPAVILAEGIFLVASVVVHPRLEVVLPSAMTSVIALGPDVLAHLKMDQTTEPLEQRYVVLQVPPLPYHTLQVDRRPKVSHLAGRN